MDSANGDGAVLSILATIGIGIGKRERKVMVSFRGIQTVAFMKNCRKIGRGLFPKNSTLDFRPSATKLGRPYGVTSASSWRTPPPTIPLAF